MYGPSGSFFMVFLIIDPCGLGTGNGTDHLFRTRSPEAPIYSICWGWYWYIHWIGLLGKILTGNPWWKNISICFIAMSNGGIWIGVLKQKRGLCRKQTQFVESHDCFGQIHTLTAQSAGSMLGTLLLVISMYQCIYLKFKKETLKPI